MGYLSDIIQDLRPQGLGPAADGALAAWSPAIEEQQAPGVSPGTVTGIEASGAHGSGANSRAGEHRLARRAMSPTSPLPVVSAAGIEARPMAMPGGTLDADVSAGHLGEDAEPDPFSVETESGSSSGGVGGRGRTPSGRSPEPVPDGPEAKPSNGQRGGEGTRPSAFAAVQTASDTGVPSGTPAIGSASVSVVPESSVDGPGGARVPARSQAPTSGSLPRRGGGTPPSGGFPGMSEDEGAADGRFEGTPPAARTRVRDGAMGIDSARPQAGAAEPEGDRLPANAPPVRAEAARDQPPRRTGAADPAPGSLADAQPEKRPQVAAPLAGDGLEIAAAAGSQAPPSEPRVRIGRIDVLVAAPSRAEPSLAAPPSDASMASRRYLRRL